MSKSLDSWVEQAHQWVFNNYTYEGHRSFYIPAGNTPLPLYRYWEESRPQLLSQCQLIQIDEVLEGKKSNMFFHFFEENLPSWTSKLISPHENYHQGDAALLGLGLNGHLGFHEPELPEEVFFACVPLSPLTCKNLKLSASAWG
ncbi:MAG: hypothetical protein KDD35_08845, partial [Bdellovibrionales bacterium]|nr:hypothetical protein [Bdellovibrionales bacterium]